MTSDFMTQKDLQSHRESDYSTKGLPWQMEHVMISAVFVLLSVLK